MGGAARESYVLSPKAPGVGPVLADALDTLRQSLPEIDVARVDSDIGIAVLEIPPPLVETARRLVGNSFVLERNAPLHY